MTIIYKGRPLTSYVDPYPGRAATDRVEVDCGMCNGTGVYSGKSGYKWQRGNRVSPWCFHCGGSGKRSIQVKTARQYAKAEAYYRDYADELMAERRAQYTAEQAAQFAEDWDEAHAEQARRAALVTGFLAEVGEKVTATGVVQVAKSYSTRWNGHLQTGMFVVVKLDNGQVIKTSGSGRTLFELERGARVELTGKVKAHETYRGQDQTVLVGTKASVLADA